METLGCTGTGFRSYGVGYRADHFQSWNGPTADAEAPTVLHYAHPCGRHLENTCRHAQ